MNLLKLNVDVDGVLANIDRSIIERWAPGRSSSEITQWNIDKALGIPELFDWMVDAVVNDDFCYNIEPFDGAKEFIDNLSSLGDVHVVTAPFRTPEWLLQRSKWLIDKLNVPFKKQHHTSSKDWYEFGGFPGDVLIDDKPDNIAAFVTLPGRLGILFDRPWNRSSKCVNQIAFHRNPGSKVARCATYDDVIDTIVKNAEFFRGRKNG